jgi:uncharacterized membrane protein YbaN (DUF454 family)
MRRLFVVPVGLLVLLILAFVIGFAGQAPFFLVLSTLCFTPLFLLALGFAFGKASNRYQFFVPKEVMQQQPVQRRQRLATNYEAQSGDLRGN